MNPKEEKLCSAGCGKSTRDCENCQCDCSFFADKYEKQRTLQQNKALHLYFQLIADRLNEAGLDMKAVLKDVEIPWGKDTVKDFLWRPVQELQVGKQSTTELNTKEIDEIYDTLNRHLAQFGIHESWPSLESIFEKMLLEDESEDESEIGDKCRSCGNFHVEGEGRL